MIAFDSLPLWRGPERRPGRVEAYPLSVGWDRRGYMHLATHPDVRAQVVAAYADPDYSFITTPPGGSAWANQLGAEQLDYVRRFAHGRRADSVLEIGSGSLFVATRLRQALSPDDYVVVDPSVPRDQSAEGVAVIRDYFPAPALAGRRFDLIVSFNCLEHLEDPGGFLAAVAAHLTPGGQAMICVPDVERQFVRGDLNALLHEHLSYFTRASLLRLVSGAGLACLDISQADDNMWCVMRPHGEGLAAPASGIEVLDAGCQAFERILGEVGPRVRARLDADGRIAFHGATNGLNNFLHLAGLSGHPGVTVFDGDESKAGLFLPTCPNPIRASSDPAYGQVGRIHVSAMSFFEPIRRFAVQRQGLAPDCVEPLFP